MSLPRFLLGLLLGRRRSVERGEVAVPGLSNLVTIRRTEHGIPCIEAENDTDAMYGIGFCHGQDRGGQLELILRIARGTMAEWVGLEGLPIDRLSRRIGFRRAGLARWPAIDPDVRAMIAAYTAGINAAYANGITAPPHEFRFLGGEPTPWEPDDVLAFGSFQSFLLPGNWDVELARLKMLRTDGPDAIAALDPHGPAVDFSVANGGNSDSLDVLLRDLRLFQQLVPTGGGSNNWTIHGSRTASGKPILCNDPHLAPSLPAPWYLLNVQTPEWSVTGATFAGSPVIPIGHNSYCAWGVTAGLTDNTDLFLETLGPNGTTVREADGQFHARPIVDEVIHVKGADNVIERVLVTPRGPIISPIVPGLTEAVSMRAIWMDPLPLRGFMGVMRAKSFSEFRKPFEHWPALPLNVVYADESGNIGYQLIGNVPVRSLGNGTVPLPGDAAGAGWKGLVPFADMPSATNPGCGYFATANGPPPVPAASFIGVDFVDPYRADTIGDELSKHTNWDVAGCQRLHLNVRCMPWEQMREMVLLVAVADEAAIEALKLLKEWDGQVTADSSAAAVYELFVADLSIRIAKAKAPKSWATAVGGGDSHEPMTGSTFNVTRAGHLIKLLTTKPGGWFPEGWDRAIEQSLTAAVRRLRDVAGPGSDYWGWGHLRPLTFTHPLVGKHWLLGRIFNLGPFPCGGDPNTINQAAHSPLGVLVPTHFMPNMRAVFDTADWSRSRFSLAGGQSGNPCSPHFDDLLPFWQAGEGVPIPHTRDDAIKAAVNTLRLKPHG